MRQIASTLHTRGKLSREEATQAIRRVTGELAGLAEQAAAQATAVVRNGRRAVPKALSGRVRGRDLTPDNATAPAPDPTSFDLAGLKDVDGFGELPGFPRAAAELA